MPEGNSIEWFRRNSTKYFFLGDCTPLLLIARYGMVFSAWGVPERRSLFQRMGLMNKLPAGAFVALLLIFAVVNAQEPEIVTVRKFTFSWLVHGDSLTGTLVAPVRGWVACGFKPIKKMKGANIIIGNSVEGTATIVDHFGTGAVKHEADTTIGGTNDISSANCSEKEGKTTLTFTIPLSSEDATDVMLKKGEKVKVIFAASKSDNLKTRHSIRTSVEITL